MFNSCFTRSQTTTSRWVLPHIYWDWWNSDNDKNKQMNNSFNINAMEIVKKKEKKIKKKSLCFHLRAMHTILIILQSSNILVKLPNLLTCRDKALTSPSMVPPLARCLCDPESSGTIGTLLAPADSTGTIKRVCWHKRAATHRSKIRLA